MVMTCKIDFILIIVLVILISRPAHAYTDPGSGALLIQILFAAFFGMMFYIRRIIRFFKKKFFQKDNADAA